MMIGCGRAVLGKETGSLRKEWREDSRDTAEDFGKDCKGTLASTGGAMSGVP